MTREFEEALVALNPGASGVVARVETVAGRTIFQDDVAAPECHLFQECRIELVEHNQALAVTTEVRVYEEVRVHRTVRSDTQTVMAVLRGERADVTTGNGTDLPPTTKPGQSRSSGQPPG